jgi:hypothetical protein
MIDLAQLPIFPCNLAKEPLTAHGFKDAKRGARGWKAWPLVGFPTGARSGFDVLDIDPDGRKWFDQNFHSLPQTLAHSTQRGLHLLFKHAAGLRCSTGKIADGIDVRADGGYAIYWPSTGLPVDDAPICEWPEWLLTEAMSDVSVLKRPYSRVDPPHPRHGKPYRRTFNPKARIATLMHRLETARPRTRNDTLNATAYVFGRMIVEGCIRTRQDAEWLLRSGATINGLWRDPFDGPDKCKATIKSGLDAGIQDEMRDRDQRPEYGLYGTASILTTTFKEITE